MAGTYRTDGAGSLDVGEECQLSGQLDVICGANNKAELSSTLPSNTDVDGAGNERLRYDEQLSPAFSPPPAVEDAKRKQKRMRSHLHATTLPDQQALADQATLTR